MFFGLFESRAEKEAKRKETEAKGADKMMKIYKYDADNKMFPVGAKFLSAIVQNGKIVVYAAVDPDVEELEYRRIHCVGTGWEILGGWGKEGTFLDGTQFLGTVQDGILVWHIFVEDK